MQGPVEQREPVADERRADWIVEKRSHRLVRPFPLKEEDDLGLGQEDDVSVDGFLQIVGAQSRVFGEKSLRSLITVGIQTGGKDEAIHEGKPRRDAARTLSSRKGDEMKIVVIGGTGLIGSKLVEKLRVHGHEAVQASPDSGVNTLTGEGLAEVLEGAQVVVDVSNSPSFEDEAVLAFFETSTRNLLKAESASAITSRCPSWAPTASPRAGTSAPRSPRRS